MGGVSRFDGERFNNFSTEHGLIDNQVNCFFEDNKNTLWLGCPGGISKFNGAYFQSFGFEDSLANYMVLDIEELDSGDLLVATNGAGLFLFNPVDNIFKRLNSFSGGSFVRKIKRAANGDLLIGSRSGLDRIVPPAYDEPKVVLDDVSVSDIGLTESGAIWVATFGDGLFLLESDEILNIRETEGLQNDLVREIAIEKTGHVWLASRSGLNKVSPAGVPTITTNVGLNYDNIKTLFIDREENLWIGTDGKGVYRLTGEQFVTYSKEDGLNSDIVMAIQKNPGGGMWLGSYDNGACLFQGDSSKFFTTQNGLMHNTIWCILPDNNGRVWLGNNIGVTRWENGQFTNMDGAETGQLFNRVTAMHQDKSGRIWLGIVDGIAVYENERFLHRDELPDFPGKRVRCIFESTSGDIWFGAEDGLVRRTDQGFIRYEVPSSSKNSVVYNVAEDANSTIWVGTKGGLFVLRNEKLEQVDFSDGFGSNNINFLQIDSRNHLYIGTNNGLFVLDASVFYNDDNIRIEHFTDQEGLASLECNQNAVFLDKDKQLWFGTTEGVIRYDTRNNPFAAADHQPLTIINNVKLILEEKDWREFADSVDLRTGLPLGLELAHTNNHLTFEFVGFYYSNPGKVRYQYMLEGIDENWLPETPTNYATYASLPHGDYTFKVRSRIANTEWQNRWATFEFSILPPFYLTWWFMLLSAVLILLAVTGLVYALLKNEERKRKTEQLVFASRMLSLEQQTLNSSMNRHFIFNALNSIQYYINRQDKLSANKYLSSFARLIRKNLDSSQSNFTSLSDEIERIELYLSLENMRFPDKFTYKITVDPAVDTHTVQIPAMLFQPYLENSIWHGILPLNNIGQIKVDVSLHGEDVVIKIEDNGIGIDESRKLREKSDGHHIPQGMQINQNRIELFRKMTNQNFKIVGPHDLSQNATGKRGTIVAITFPTKSAIESALNT